MARRMPVPYPVRPRASAPWRNLPDVKALVRDAPVRHVPLSKLVGYQRTVGAEYVDAYAEDMPDAPPIVFWSGGRGHVYDGNHRSSARIQRGDVLTPARVVDLDGEIAARKFQSSAVLAMHRDACTEATFVPRAVEDVAEMVGSVAVISICGPLEAKGSSYSWWWGFDNYESILCRFRSAIESDEVSSVLLKIDSNGGDAAGLNECVDAMIKLKKQTGKMVCAWADEAAYSAAYAVACVADEIYLPRSGGLGSIGVRSGIISFDEANKKAGVAIELFATGSKKLLGDPDAPITDAARARVQRRIGQLGEFFFETVAQSRDMSVRKVKALEADVFFGSEAAEKGLADSVMSLDDVLAEMAQLDTSGTRESGSTRAPADSSRSQGMSAILALRKAVTDARSALRSAKTSRAREDAADALEIAKARLGAADGKMVKDKKTITTIHESESESSESSESSEESSETESESESESASAGYESESESAEGGEAERAAASLVATLHGSDRKHAKIALKAVRSLAKITATMLAVTGKSSLRSALGSIEAAFEERKALRDERKREKSERRSEKIDALIAQGIAAGKITPAKVDRIKSKAIANGVEWLETFLEDANAVIDPPKQPKADPPGTAAITDQMREIWLASGFTEADFPKLAAQHAKDMAGKSGRNGVPS